MKMEGRGRFQVFERDDQKMCATKWFDSKPVFLFSTAHAVTPVDTVKRWSKKDRDHVDMRRPSVVRLYNLCMGGVDLVDFMVSLYRIKARTNKWLVRVVMHFLDCAVSKAWILYREAAKECGTPKKYMLDFIEFRLRIGEMFVKNPSQPEEDAVSEGEAKADLFKGKEGWFRTPFLNCGKVRQFTFQSLSNQARATGITREDARATLASDALPAMSSYVWQEIKLAFSCTINRAGISTTVRSIFTK